MLIMNGVSVAIIYFGAHGVDNGTMQVGNMMAFIQYAMQIIMSFLMITAISIMPVSYTHLDVYKRQIWYRAEQNENQIGKL